MSTRHPLKYRVLRRKPAHYGVCEVKRRGKGAHRMFVGVVSGRTVKYPVTCHSEGDDVAVSVVEAVRRAFGLTPAGGVTDADFYS